MLTRNKILELKSLGDKRERNAKGLFVAEGIKLVSELIASDLKVREVFVLEKVCDELPHFPQTYVVTPKEMDRISQLKTPSVAFATIEIPQSELSVDELSKSLSLALDGVQDPGNLGTMIRICDWFGIKDIICAPSCADCFNPKTVQATMGAISRVRVHYADLSILSAINAPVYGTFLGGKNIYKEPLSQHGVIVMGSEGRGISPEIAELVTDKLYIPPFPVDTESSESLNVAAATAVICSEFRRR